MTAIEQETLADGFLVCVMDVRLDRTTGRAMARVDMFDGGRPVETWVGDAWLRDPSPDYFRTLQSFMNRVAAPPHVMVVTGRGWREILLRMATPTLLARHRILDLRPTAVALGKGLRPGSTESAIARAYRISRLSEPDPFAGPSPVDLFWAVLAEAGRCGYDWPRLLAAAGTSRKSPPFDRYTFNEAEVKSLPETPGVYAMRDASGSILYVGKTGNLRRRMAEYFRPVFSPDDKLRVLRDRVRSLEVHPVGSELEAELIEDRWIRERCPEINVQRQVEVGASRYAGSVRSICLLARSRHAGCMDLFVWAAGRSALQLSFRPDRPPKSTLAALHAYVTGRTGRRLRATRLTDWGARGAELCVRHFGRRRPSADWFDPDASPTGPAFAATVVRAAQSLGAGAGEPGEFRDMDRMPRPPDVDIGSRNHEPS